MFLFSKLYFEALILKLFYVPFGSPWWAKSIDIIIFMKYHEIKKIIFDCANDHAKVRPLKMWYTLESCVFIFKIGFHLNLKYAKNMVK